MALSIKNPEADHLASELTQRTGESVTQAIIIAMRERLVRLQVSGTAYLSTADDLMAIGSHCAALPRLDERSADEILGYGAHGYPE